ncbi:MAG: peptidylprolyl isomerase [Bryobacteraceae bacterium]
MFDLFRSREKSVRILMTVLLGLIAISMLWYLIPGGSGGLGSGGDNVVASVGDEKITTTDLQRGLQAVTRGQANLPKSIMAMYAPMMLNQMIEGKAMAYKARQMGLKVSDQELGDAIENQFAAQLGGKFDINIYRSVLAQQGLTERDFETRQRESMLASRLENLEMQSLIVTDAEARAEYQRKNLKVGLQYLSFDSKAFAGKVDKNPSLVKAYFDKNRSTFRIPEKRDFDYMVGSSADFVQSAHISESDLQRAYREGMDSYRQPERVQVRHILIKTQGKPKEEVPKLKAKAEDILKQLQHGGDFAELAKKNSEDTGSGAKGGELGYIVRGQTVPNFEKAAFSLKPGELSGIVETEYGYHILQVENKQEAHTQTFEEVRPQLLAEAQKQAGAESLTKAIEAAHSEVSKNPGQDEAIAKKYGLKFFRLNGSTNGQTLPELNTPEVTSAIFSASKGTVTNVVNVDAQGKDAFAVVKNIVPARNAEFNEVQSDVLQKYTDAEASRLAQDAAKAAADRAKKGETLEAIGKSLGVPVKTAAPFSPDGAAEGIGPASLFPGLFNDKVGDVVGPVAAQSAQFVCKVAERIPADMTQFAKNKDSVVQSINQQRQAVQQPLFRDHVVSELKRQGKVKINQETMNRLVGSYQS